MEKHGPDFYDTESVFATYAVHCNRTESPNETMDVCLELTDASVDYTRSSRRLSYNTYYAPYCRIGVTFLQ